MSADLTKNNPLFNSNMYAEGPLPTPQDDGQDPKNPYLAGHRPMEMWMQEFLQKALEKIRDMANDPTDVTFDKMFGFFPD